MVILCVRVGITDFGGGSVCGVCLVAFWATVKGTIGNESGMTECVLAVHGAETRLGTRDSNAVGW